ncbi:MAG: S-methyl-5'-thioadenosine phosphorylase [Myxococcota bacterium]|nr:S-methyl-5'-thioadenosine phosphorylase [Myxococcota bacterium]
MRNEPAPPAPVVAIIGGSGHQHFAGLQTGEEIRLDTPFGAPSAPIVRGALDGQTVYFLPRHGAGHHLIPSDVPYRANVWALKKLGVNWAISISAVGSLAEHIAPGDVVIPDQLIDRTFRRVPTFFGDGVAAHIQFSKPCCPVLAAVLAQAARQELAREPGAVHAGGTYVCIEGPALSTRAESELYRSWGARVIGMTALPEAKLFREAEIAWAQLALCTDYDCWREGAAEVSVETVLAVLRANVAKAQRTARAAVPLLARAPRSLAHDALGFALITRPEHMSAETRQRLEPLLARYMAG